MSYLSRAEREGYAALERAGENNHVMLLDDRWQRPGHLLSAHPRGSAHHRGHHADRGEAGSRN
jgi:hypothetical protein